jgi:two-component system LytT family sensor kinase
MLSPKFYINKTIFICSIAFFSFITITKADEKDSLKHILDNKYNTDTSFCNAYAQFIELEENDEIWTIYNLKFITLLRKILNQPNLQQSEKKWYIKKLVTALMYESQNIMNKKGDYEKALSLNYEMLKLSKSINDRGLESKSYNEIGTKHYVQKNFTDALIFFKKSMENNLALRDSFNLNIDYNNIALTYSDLNNFNVALEYNFKSLEIRKKLKLVNAIPICYNNLGVVYKKLKQYDNALFYFKKAYHLNDSLKNNKFKTRNLGNIATILISQNKHNEALPYAIQGFELSQSLKDIEHTSVAAMLLNQIYKAQNKPKQALEMLELHMKMKDSLLNDANKTALLKSEFKYKNDLKQAEVNDLKQKNEISRLQTQRRNIIFIVTIAILILSILLAYMLFLKYKRKKETQLIQNELREKENLLIAERKASDSELKALKSQMNPHFIFNALNSIQEQFMYGNKIKANEQMGNFTYLTRKILEISGKKSISIATEIEILEKYLQLEKMRFGDDFTYVITTDDSIDKDYHKFPPMLLQPIVENCVKHGLLHKEGNKHIAIGFQLSEDEKYYLCTIEDNGIGRKKSMEINTKNTHKHISFSTQSIKDRLEIFNENQNGLTYIDVVDENQNIIGTKVIIQLRTDFA